MIKNITLSAEEDLIAEARAKAGLERKSLNKLFREWLSAYVGRGRSAASYEQLMERLGYASSGRRFSREELNER